jgi:hypothetical protein
MGDAADFDWTVRQRGDGSEGEERIGEGVEIERAPPDGGPRFGDQRTVGTLECGTTRSGYLGEGGVTLESAAGSAMK